MPGVWVVTRYAAQSHSRSDARVRGATPSRRSPRSDDRTPCIAKGRGAGGRTRARVRSVGIDTRRAEFEGAEKCLAVERPDGEANWCSNWCQANDANWGTGERGELGERREPKDDGSRSLQCPSSPVAEDSCALRP